MTKEIWINLPVKNIDRSKAFFTALGFSLNPQFSGTDAACVQIGQKGVIMMLFNEVTFEGFTRNKIADTIKGTEVLFSIDAESREEVDEMLSKAIKAGGSVVAESGEKDGWMYGCAFADLDGHRWNVLYMDFSKLPK
jgi:predicted lactoylglutathione lyase